MARNLINQVIVTGITRFPRLELLGRYAGAFAGGAILGFGACYIVVKGYYVPDHDTWALLIQTIVGVGVTGLAAKLGLNAQQKADLTVVANTMEAAATGLVPAAIAAKATPEQLAKVEASPQAVIAPVPPLPPAVVP
jgi:hypothetical protein